MGTNFGYVGQISPGLGFHCVLRRIDQGPGVSRPGGNRPGVEAISTLDTMDWTIVAISDEGGEVARLRGRNWFFDPLAGMQILMPRRPGVRLKANPVVLLLSFLGLRLRVPPPFDRTLRFRRRATGVGARWIACEDDARDRILMVLVAFRFWLELQRSAE